MYVCLIFRLNKNLEVFQRVLWSQYLAMRYICQYIYPIVCCCVCFASVRFLLCFVNLQCHSTYIADCLRWTHRVMHSTTWESFVFTAFPALFCKLCNFCPLSLLTHFAYNFRTLYFGILFVFANDWKWLNYSCLTGFCLHMIKGIIFEDRNCLCAFNACYDKYTCIIFMKGNIGRIYVWSLPSPWCWRSVPL
jgi:hypothetical protein